MMKVIRRILKGSRNDRGFTLVELMIVVVIIGVLASVAIPQFTNQTDKAKDKAAKADLVTINQAIQLYYLDEGSYPANLAALKTADYLQQLNEDDPWGTDYVYSSSDGSIYSYGKDGAVGGGDDITL